MEQKIIYKNEDNHVPDEIFRLSRDHNVFIKDKKTGELIQIIDLKED